MGEEYLTVYSLIPRIGIGEMLADVAEGKRTEEGIAKRMDRYIGIAMAEESMSVRNFYAADPEIAVFYETMDIKSLANS